MRKYILPLALLLSVQVMAQTNVEVSRDPKNGSKTLKGLLTKEVFQNDTAFNWYAENLAGYKAYGKAVTALQQNKDSIQLLVFMGTWCDDSHFVIPKLFALSAEAGFSTDRITMFGVDRKKQTLGHLSEAMGITNVPTIIVLKNGKELGRVVEYGKTGLFDMDLAQILDGTAH